MAEKASNKDAPFSIPKLLKKSPLLTAAIYGLHFVMWCKPAMAASFSIDRDAAGTVWLLGLQPEKIYSVKYSAPGIVRKQWSVCHTIRLLNGKRGIDANSSVFQGFQKFFTHQFPHCHKSTAYLEFRTKYSGLSPQTAAAEWVHQDTGSVMLFQPNATPGTYFVMEVSIFKDRHLNSGNCGMIKIKSISSSPITVGGLTVNVPQPVPGNLGWSCRKGEAVKR